MRSSLFETQNQEVQVADDSFGVQNPWMLKVALAGGEFLARQGAAVGWQGDIDISFEGAGMKKFLKKAMTGEDLQLMRVAGRGDVFLANYADQVHVIELENDGITLNGQNVLAFAAGLEWDIKRVKGFSGMLAQGLANVEVSGTGSVALTSIGQPVVLDTSAQPTYVDPQAAIAWSSSLTPTVKKNEGFGRTLIGRGSGEAYSMLFHGPGWVIVQPAEGRPTSVEAQQGRTSGGALGSMFN